MPTIHDTEVIAPNFKKRLSGVTSTIVQLVPIQRQLGLKIAAVGPGLPNSVAKLPLWSLLGLFSLFRGAPARVWHARRNTEIVGGLILKHVFRAPLKLVFTSASQRHHQWFTKWLIGCVDFVIATSKKTADYLEVQNEVIMHGIDTSRFTPAKDMSDAKKALGLCPNARLIGCFGRIRHQKGTDLFVKSMINILPSYPGWTAIIAGRTTLEHISFEHELRERIATAGLTDRILFVGEHTNIEKWYQVLTLYVAPQRWEGFGLTPLEAMACGVPVVATDVGAFAELVLHGETGQIIEKDNLSLMVESISSYLSDAALVTKHGASALRHVRKNFPLEREAQQLLNVYERLLGKRCIKTD